MTTPPEEDEDEFTELIDARFGRVDLVSRGANGVPRFLIAKADESSAGLLEPGFVRDLIAKAEPEPAEAREQVTVSGSPAAIAAMIHKAAQRPARPADDVAKAKNDTADREHKAATGAAMPDGSYPIASEADLGKAIKAVGRGGSSHNVIRKHIITRAKSLGASSKIPDNWNSDGSLKGDSVSKEADGAVAKAAGGNPDLDEGVDGLDPTVVLAAPDEEAPGDPAEPGSPAWEAIDAATASKWLTILSRTQVALSTLAEREMLEAASADPGDCENAWDLEDACCAIDYAISVVAPYAVAEQCEADVSGEEMAGIAKAMATDTSGPLTVIEALTAVRKAGRVLSNANESLIRQAAGALQQVLSTLPSAPIAPDDVAKEAAMAADTTTTAPAAQNATETAPAATEAVTKAAAVTTTSTGPAPAEGAASAEPAAPVAKADTEDGKPTMQAVFNQDGDLIGIVDPSAITPVSGAGGKPATDAPAAEPAPAAAGADLEPAPAADAGTPADGVAKQAETSPATERGDERQVLKGLISEAVREVLGTRSQPEDVAKGAVAELAGKYEELLGRLETVEKQDATPKTIRNGAMPPADQMRGQNQPPAGEAPVVDVAKATELKAVINSTTATPAARNAAYRELQEMAIGAVHAVHGG